MCLIYHSFIHSSSYCLTPLCGPVLCRSWGCVLCFGFLVFVWWNGDGWRGSVLSFEVWELFWGLPAQLPTPNSQPEAWSAWKLLSSCRDNCTQCPISDFRLLLYNLHVQSTWKITVGEFHHTWHMTHAFCTCLLSTFYRWLSSLPNFLKFKIRDVESKESRDATAPGHLSYFYLNQHQHQH